MDLDTEVDTQDFATHASLCNTLSSNKLCPKKVKILALKGLKKLPIRKSIRIFNFENSLKILENFVKEYVKLTFMCTYVI